LQIDYTAEPTAARFHASDAVCRGFKGPVGNGKSVTCIMEGLRLSVDQWPNAQGIRKSRGVIVRNTNPELRTTTLKTFQQWIPDRICHIALNPIIQGTMRQKLGDGTVMEMEVIFLSIDRVEDVKKLLSLECTWIFLNEVREMPYATVKASRERIGRYPSVIDGYQDVHDDNGKLIYDAPKERNHDGSAKLDKDGEPQYTPCKRKALLMDTNPPDDMHWYYQLAENGYLKGAKNKEAAKAQTKRIFEFFNGPSPLIKEADGTYTPSPEAENIKHLPGGYQYYLDMIAGNTEDHINVMVMGNYGSIMEGKPVYPQYNDRVHCPEKLIGAYRGIPLCLGWDFGLTPAVIIGQLTDIGQCRIIHELTSEDMSVVEFARDVVKPFLQKHYGGTSFDQQGNEVPAWEIGFSFGDPAGNNRGEGEGKSAIGLLNDDYIMQGDTPLNMGFTTEPAPTNDPTLRINAVSSFMIKLCGGGEPGYLLNRSCEILRKGKIGAYHYRRIQRTGEDARHKDKPEKNWASHPSDAEQYLCLGFQGGFVTDSNEEWEDYEDDRRDVGIMGY